LERKRDQRVISVVSRIGPDPDTERRPPRPTRELLWPGGPWPAFDLTCRWRLVDAHRSVPEENLPWEGELIAETSREIAERLGNSATGRLWVFHVTVTG
jgi:hypothetical protein